MSDLFKQFNEAAKDPDEKKAVERCNALIAAMREEAFRFGWAKGFEKGFAQGVEAALGSKPRISLD